MTVIKDLGLTLAHRALHPDRVKGGAILGRMLELEGVTDVFGIIDGTYFGFYESLSRHGMRLWSPRHETCAAHMAGAYARLTGRLGVCMASNGPGVANILPGVAVENAEGNRVLLITSCRRTGITDPDRGGAYQYFRQVDVIRPMAKLSVAVPSVERLPELARQALRACFTGRPGVVHLDVPESVMNADLDPHEGWYRQPSAYRVTTGLSPDRGAVRAAAALLRAAKRPVIHAGSGVTHAQATAELAALARSQRVPVTTSWGARAVLDERLDVAVPMQHVEVVNRARTEADLVLILGSRVGETDWWGKPPYWGRPGEQRTIQVDLDADCLGRTRAADLLVQADVRLFLQGLLEELGPAPVREPTRDEFIARLSADRRRDRARLDEHLSDLSLPMGSAHVPAVCRRVFADDAIAVMDGGNTAIWANFFHEVRVPDSVLGTPKMGMLGAGVSQALGAKVAYPNRQVFCVIGDGAMGFHQQEIETAVRNGLQVIYLVLCDRQWGMVKINQSFALDPLRTIVKRSLPPEETINADLSETQFDVLARSMGAHGERVADPLGLEGAIQRSLRSGKPAVIHVDVDPVRHMWAPALKTFKDMHAEPAG
ncbi:MAG: thiamine pyrophosphate-binding protein [Polyangiaceae bacterium]|nr:thiamine pyrophosphate-binding protein [Polyangiaceae bacterium]